MKKHSYSKIKNIALLGISMIIWGVFATQIWLSDSLETWFPGLSSWDAAVHFVTVGNDFGWLFFLRGAENVSSDGVIFSGQTITCTKKLKGLYYNSARGNRVWPLDQESLNNLQGVNSAYNTVTVTGWLYTRCIGKDPNSIAGQVTVTRKGTSYKLLAGVQMNSNNTYTKVRADNLQYTWGTFSGKLFDNYGGVANILWTGLTVDIDFTGIIIPISPSYTTTNSGISIGNTPATITVDANTSIIFWWMGDTTAITNPANIPLTGGNINLSGGVIIGSTTVIPGEIVQVNVSWTSLIIYQSGNTGSYVEIPDNTYIIGPSGRNNTLISPTIVGNTITFWDNTPLLFIPPIKIFFGNMVAWTWSYGVPQRRNYGETTRHSISTVCNTTFNTLPTNISLTGANKECYQTNGVDTIVWTHHATQYQIPTVTQTQTTSSQWGGGWNIQKDVCTISNTSRYNLSGANDDGIDYSPSYYDHTCEWPIPENIPPVHDIAQVCLDYTNELNQAYDFAYSFNITTINPCTQVRMYDTLIRKDMAKMMVNFALKVLNRQDIYVDNSNCENYTDISSETPDMKIYIETACKLGLMGLDSDGVTPLSSFNPYGIVTRAQFGTVLSRILRGTDNSAHGSAPYYQQHLSALKQAGIMNNINNPKMKEVRGRVFIMMNRIYNMGIDN